MSYGKLGRVKRNHHPWKDLSSSSNFAAGDKIPTLLRNIWILPEFPQEKKKWKNHTSNFCFLFTVKPELVSLAPMLLARRISQVCSQPKKTVFLAVQLTSLANWTGNKSRNLLTCSGIDTLALQMWQVPSPDPDRETGNIISQRITNSNRKLLVADKNSTNYREQQGDSEK